ncbi:MAG: aldehyde dehydrogenase family protein, partial [Clostridium sp.]
MKMLVGESFTEASDKATQEVINPANGQVVDTVPSATQEDVKKAIDTAVEGQKEWAARTVRERTAVLKKFAAEVMARRLELGKILAVESGKPYMKEAVWELDSVAYVFEGSCEVAKHYYGKTMPLGTEPGYDHDIQFTIHEPLGVIACIIPFNFPPAIWSFKVAAALAAGNAVIVKAPSYNPLTILKLHEMLVEAGVPASVVQCLTGSGSKVGNWLVDDSRIASVNFTGSAEVGVNIAEKIAPHLTAYQFELGGNDPFIVFEDADMDLAVKEAGDQCR